MDATLIYQLIKLANKHKQIPDVCAYWFSFPGENDYIYFIDIRLPIDREHIINQMTKKYYPISENPLQQTYIDFEGYPLIIHKK
jgi:hypothetical protein